MTLSQHLRDPSLPPGIPTSGAALHAALRRAMEAADDVGAGARPWRLYVLGPEMAAAGAWLAARRMEAEVGPEGARAAYEQWRAVPGWIVVTTPRPADPEQAERDREACLTAAQRCSLSLWSDNVPSNWSPDLVADDDAFFGLIEADPAREVPLGVLLYGHPERAG